jgi:hypothetical protein
VDRFLAFIVFRTLFAVLAFGAIVAQLLALLDNPTFHPLNFPDPANGGYGTVALYCIGVFVLVAAVCAAVVWIDNLARSGATGAGRDVTSPLTRPTGQRTTELELGTHLPVSTGQTIEEVHLKGSSGAP